MNCTKCGKEIPDGENKLCDECKNSLLSDIGNENDNKFEIKKETKKETKAKDDKKVPKKKSKTGLVIVIIFILAIVAGVALEVTTKTFSTIFLKQNIVGIDIGDNNNNLGCATIQGDWIYYMSLDDEGTEIAINRVRTDGTEKQLLVQKDWEIYSINAVGNYLYFVAYEPLENEGRATDISAATAYPINKIYKMSVDGKDLTVINDGQFSGDCMTIYVVRDRIYYIGENYNIYSMDTFGGDRKKINSSETGFIGVTDKYILYNDHPEGSKEEEDYVTYIMNLDGTNARVLNGKRLYNPNIVGDVIYYVSSENNAIYRVNVDGTNDEKVYDSKAYNMNVEGDYIYYLNYRDESVESSDDSVCIHRVRVDGTNHEIIEEMENYTSFINILNDWIYYTDHSDNAYYINLVKTDGSDKINLYTFDFSVPSISTQTTDDITSIEQ